MQNHCMNSNNYFNKLKSSMCNIFQYNTEKISDTEKDIINYIHNNHKTIDRLESENLELRMKNESLVKQLNKVSEERVVSDR